MKSRYVTHDTKNQLLRVDNETFFEHNQNIMFDLDKFDAIIISDYNKGAINKTVMEDLKKTNVPIFIDPKPNNQDIYIDSFMITPNKKEYELMKDNLRATYILKTLGDQGLELTYTTYNTVKHIPTNPVQVFNVCGCGDTVVSVVTSCYCMGLDLITSSKIANECARIVATKSSTVPIYNTEFNTILQKFIGE